MIALLVLALAACAAETAPEPVPAPILDPVPTCTSDPCDNVACKTAPGQEWIRDYTACTCTCKVPWR